MADEHQQTVNGRVEVGFLQVGFDAEVDFDEAEVLRGAGCSACWPFVVFLEALVLIVVEVEVKMENGEGSLLAWLASDRIKHEMDSTNCF